MNQESMSLRSAYVELLSSMDTKYHLTITFPMHTSKASCQNLLNLLLKNLNRRIYKKRYDKGQSYIQGAVIKEHTYAMDTDHYHILVVDDHHLPDYERMKNLIEKQLQLLGNDEIHTKKKNYIAGYCLQHYYNSGSNNLEEYLTKQFEKVPSFPLQAADAVGLLGNGRVMFGSSVKL